jgi:hypothetical protein
MEGAFDIGIAGEMNAAQLRIEQAAC